MTDTTETRALAERVLSAALGGPVRLGEGAPLADRDHVFRLPLLDAPAGAPASVIAKRARTWGSAYDPDSADTHNPAWGLLAEWHGLQFLESVAGDAALVPRIYGGDRSQGLVLLEDLGSGGRPDQLLLGDDAQQAEAVLIELATALGTMHARTIGRQAEYAAAGAALGRASIEPGDDVARLAVGLLATLEVLGISPPPGLDADLAALQSAIHQPGPFWAYTHGDPCPDNWLRVGGRLRLLDFERGAFRHALLDGVYGRIHFPTCWCVNRLPAGVARRMEDAYRQALLPGCPAAGDDAQFGRAVAAACAYWVIDLLTWAVERPAWFLPPQLMARDRRWGISTLQQRMLLRTALLAETLDEYRHFEAIGRAVDRVAARLRAEWPASADTMPLYPAFRTSG